MPMNLEITGLGEMRAKFSELQEIVREDATRAAVRAAGRVIQVEMERRAPRLDAKTAKSTALDPGALQSGIDMSVRKSTDGYIEASVGPSDHISHVAHWVEYGHRLVKGGYNSLKRGRFQGQGRMVGEVEQHQFLRPAVDASRQDALAAFMVEMWVRMKGVLR